MAHQHGKLIESHVQPQPLQAECHEILEEREYASPALHVENKGSALRHEVAGAGSGERLDELGLSDAGGTVDQHDPDRRILTVHRQEAVVERGDIEGIRRLGQYALDRNAIDAPQCTLQDGLLMFGPEPEVAERLGCQQSLVRCMGTRRRTRGRTLGHPTVVQEIDPQRVAVADHPHGQPMIVTRRLWRVRAEIAENGQFVAERRCGIAHLFMSIQRPSSLRKLDGREALTMNARPPAELIHASAVNSGGTTSSSSDRTSAHSFGPRLAHARRSAASAVSTIFSVAGVFLACRRSVFGR